MKKDKKSILDHWNEKNVESMYDKNLLNAEIDLIKKHIQPNSKILDAGCGEGEGTYVYSSIKGVEIHAVDFSDTRLKKASRRLKGRKNVTLKKIDFLNKYELDKDYDIIISQRFIINIPEWQLQKQVLLGFMNMLKTGGQLIMLEGSKNGANDLNEFRKAYGLEPIPIQWHNYFLSDNELINFMKKNKFKLINANGLGAYFLLTRGVRPIFDKKLNWDCNFNKIASNEKLADFLKIGAQCSRLKLWIFQK
ncbi:MAG: hypothetical protein UT33_C0010G0079 [Candidatus Peregrinibacteria bacterium GW2011_GWC2_39_14]|nr:MAG: hypothetical protein US92_C0006G0079 [Candidatus Peregrinibacteria bacterium GW2011_GWA2_38_36]KKR05936.1 MAG: hypothetical protein UT33_C0010G0079 [Candidatus Peregrinibacteria bacterium GW2011_GWC2_39_14]